MKLQQLFALAVLRYKLSLHQEKKAGRLNVVLSRLMRGILALSSALALMLPILIGPWLMQHVSPERLIGIWNVLVMIFLFSAVMALIGQLQLNEVISIDKLLHLPVSLNGAFLINYLSSFSNMLMIMFAPALIGFTIGAILSKGAGLLILFPTLLAIIFFTTSLLHQLKSIFARIMHNKRNKAILIVVVPFVMVIGFVMFSFVGDSLAAKLGSSNLVAYGIQSWMSWKPTWYAVLSFVLFGLASQYFSYRSLLKHYTGADSIAKKGGERRSEIAWPSGLLFRQLPLASVAASAVATSGFRNIVRAPEALMALVPLVILLLVGVPYLVGYGNFVVPDIARPWIQIGVVTVTMLGFPAFLFTAFSYDRDGFRAFVLSPVGRSDVLYGKNLATGIPTVISGIVLLSITQIFLPDRALAFLASLIQLPACFLAMCVLGNFLSIWFPVGLKRGSMQPANAPLLHTILLYAGVLSAPFLVVQPAMLVIFVEMLAKGNFGPISGWLYLLFSFIQLMATWWIYQWTLKPFGDLLWQHEPRILEVVANIPE